jgi:D-lactate dehydrogenase (cytochrome)
MHEILTERIEPAGFEQVRRVDGFASITAEHPAYLTDESKFSCRPFEHLFFPGSEAELAAVVKEMARRRTPVTVAGARTGLAGGCTPREGALISLENFDRILALYYDAPSSEWRLRAQCAVNLRSIAAQLAVKSIPDIERCADGISLLEMDRFRQDPDFYFYPPDPTEMSASLGGTAATNASGARTFRYGPTRDWVRGLRVMLANGEALEIPRGKYFASTSGEFTVTDTTGRDYRVRIPTYGSPRTKNTAGIFAAPHMDLVDLFIGSEGAFGIITSVTVALFKQRPKISVVQFLNTDEQAVDLVEALRADPRIRLDFLEFYSGSALSLLKGRQRRDPRSVGTPAIPESAGAALFLEMDFDPADRTVRMQALQAALERCGASPADSWAAYEGRELDRLKGFRHILPETINAVIAERKKTHPGLHKLGTDLAVPDERLRDMWAVYRGGLEGAGLEWAAFGHIGNNHVHINIMPRDMADLEKALGLYEVFAQKAVEFGGTVAAEHGIGKLKAKYLKTMFRPEEIEQMRAVKRALDPGMSLNPGNIFEG